MSLKGKNRGQFERMLKNKISAVLKGVDYKLIDDMSKILYVLVDNDEIGEVAGRLKKVFGIIALNPSAKVENDDEKIKGKGARDSQTSL